MKNTTKKTINKFTSRFASEILLVLGYTVIMGLYYYVACVLIGG
jgi:hypothetical protein